MQAGTGAVIGMVLGSTLMLSLPQSRAAKTTPETTKRPWPAELDAVVAAPKNHKVLARERSRTGP
jgi:hypothetical protein